MEVGFFQVLLPDGQIVYTRNGAFSRNDEGVLTTNSGFIIQPEIAIPAEATKINVSADGIISVQVLVRLRPRKSISFS